MYQNENFYVATKEQQVKFIVEMIAYNASQEQIFFFKDFYEAEYGVTFESDKLRYDFAFLKHVDINQAITLYDGLKDTKKLDLIKVIKLDHKHLFKLITIHDILCDMHSVDDILSNAMVTQQSTHIFN